MDNINIRPYKKEDKWALRTLCCDVADRGGPIEKFSPTGMWLLTMLTSYYTDYGAPINLCCHL